VRAGEALPEPDCSALPLGERLRAGLREAVPLGLPLGERVCTAVALLQALSLGTTVAHSPRPLSSRGQFVTLLRCEKVAVLLGEAAKLADGRPVRVALLQLVPLPSAGVAEGKGEGLCAGVCEAQALGEGVAVTQCVRLGVPLELAVPGAAVGEADAQGEAEAVARWLGEPASLPVPEAQWLPLWVTVAEAVGGEETEGGALGEALAQSDALALAQGVGEGKTVPEGLPLVLGVGKRE
jgi:hypothetical protein